MVSKTVMYALVAVVAIIIVGAGLYFAVQPAPVKAKLKIAVLLPGSITDNGWNAGMYLGAVKLEKEMNETLSISIVDGLGQIGVDPVMRDYANQGYNIIFSWTGSYLAPAQVVARDFPNVIFIVPNARQFNSNVVGFFMAFWEPAYLAGIVAAGVTNTSMLGCIGGSSAPDSIATPEGFIAGALSVNPNIKAKIVITGVWDDLGKGREAGEALIAWGADVLQSRGDGITLGAIQAASIHSRPGTNKTVYMVGDTMDQNALAPKTIITSTVFKADLCIKNFALMYLNGTLQGNKGYTWGVREGVFDIAPFHGLAYKVSAATKAKLAQVIADVKSGAFILPKIVTQIH